ncbi:MULTISPECIES: hypothetical protein [unclassified Streptomyces]|uniref:hypothetical protein n=1 Tax=unclassified Streptomyces TaxID=2593676 RepID=UPI0013DD8739|nr:hypothetical protein [Streptomyces sp. CNQ-509]
MPRPRTASQSTPGISRTARTSASRNSATVTVRRPEAPTGISWVAAGSIQPAASTYCQSVGWRISSTSAAAAAVMYCSPSASGGQPVDVLDEVAAAAAGRDAPFTAHPLEVAPVPADPLRSLVQWQARRLPREALGDQPAH